MARKGLLVFGLIVFFLTSANIIHSQTRIELVQSELLDTRKVRDGRSLTQWSGNVEWFIPEKGVTIYCDTTEFYQNSGLYTLKGNVVVVDSLHELRSDRIEYEEKTSEVYSPGPFVMTDTTGTLSARQGTYNLDTENVFARGETRFVGKKKQLDSEYLKYAKNEGKVTAYEDVRFKDAERGAVAYGDSSEYYVNEEKGVLMGKPKIAFADSTSGDSLFVYGRIVTYFGGDSARAVVDDNVIIKRADITAICQKAVYSFKDSTIFLRINPEIESDAATVKGDEIDIFVGGTSIRMVEVRNNAIALSAVDSTGVLPENHELKGDILRMFFEDDLVSRVIASQNAESTYYLLQEGSIQGTHKVTGEQIIIHFENGTQKKMHAENGVLGKMKSKSGKKR